jgi:DNA-binding MarR family transcriptional regulator
VPEFETTPDGLTHETSVQESARRLHELFPELDPLVFEAFLMTGRTWDSIQALGAKQYAVLGLTGHQLGTLRFLLLADDNRLTIGDIASRLDTSSTNVTKLVNRLERSGFVQRVTDYTDRRITRVELTQTGRDRYVATMPSSQLDREAFAVLSQDEQRTLIDLLTRVRQKSLQLLAAQKLDR